MECAHISANVFVAIQTFIRWGTVVTRDEGERRRREKKEEQRGIGVLQFVPWL